MGGDVDDLIGGFTKEELELKPGEVRLAMAVIEQWKKDGCCKGDVPFIMPYVQIVLMSMEDKNNKCGAYKVSKEHAHE